MFLKREGLGLVASPSGNAATASNICLFAQALYRASMRAVQVAIM
jgi:hypothetical protein